MFLNLYCCLANKLYHSTLCRLNGIQQRVSTVNLSMALEKKTIVSVIQCSIMRLEFFQTIVSFCDVMRSSWYAEAFDVNEDEAELT